MLNSMLGYCDIAALVNDCIINIRGDIKAGKRGGFAVLFIARDSRRHCYCAAMQQPAIA